MIVKSPVKKDVKVPLHTSKNEKIMLKSHKQPMDIPV